MMRITQNVEMKELSKDASLARTVTPELNGEDVEDFRASSPGQNSQTGKQNGLKRTTSVDGQDKELVNGQGHDSNDKTFALSASSDQERNAGTDLDALLDKISSIVDRSPKDSNVHIEDDNYNDHIEEDEIDLVQSEGPQSKKCTESEEIIEGEPEEKLLAESRGDEKVNANKELGEAADIDLKSPVTKEETIKKPGVGKTSNQEQPNAEQIEVPINGSEDSSHEDGIDDEDKLNGDPANDKPTEVADVTIIDLDSSEGEGVADEVEKLSKNNNKANKVLHSIQEEDRKAQEEKDVEEKIDKSVDEKEGNNKEKALSNENIKEKEDNDKANCEELKSNDLVTTDKATPIEESKEKEQKEDLKKPQAAEDDDDDVIFFVLFDKDKEKEVERKIEETKETKSDDPTEKKAEPTTDKKNDEIVLVSEDEDDEEPQAKKKEENTEKDVTLRTNKDFQADNSDNACDQFEKLKPLAKPKPLANENHIENNSNSSNLLRPAEDIELPPIKRKRLSNEDEMVDATRSETATTGSDKLPIVKRGHSLVEDSPSDIKKDQTSTKKLKTEDSDSNSSNDGTLQIDLDAKEEPEEITKECKDDPEKVQLKLDTIYKPIRMEFVKTFRKSFDKMTRQDLEELVLQKVVEGMLVKSEFADIRRQLDKYDSTLANYRRKIAEVSKQFVDLETVHKRVLKDLETKNSQFTVPVRITRAVGLQVGMSMKAMKSDGGQTSSSQSIAAGSSSALPSGSLSKASTSPLRSPLRGVQSGRSPHQQAALQHHQHQQQQQQHSRPSPMSATSGSSTSSSFAKTMQPAASGSPPVRRGCMQKVTPQRPGPGHHITQATTSPPTGINRSPQLGRPSIGVHVSKHTGGSPAGPTAAAAAAAAAIRARNAGAPYPNMAQKQPQQAQQYPSSRPGPSSQSSPNKPLGKMPSKVRAIPTVSVPISSAAVGGSQPNLAPAKPKDKSVIDLTDEDEAAAAAAAVQSRLNQSASVAIKRPGPASATGGTNRATSSGAGNVVRVSPMPGPTCRTNVVARSSGGGQRTSMGSNVTMQIRSENTPPSASRLRYSHPAPLPSSPAQPFNPAWKLPPSRPVIRINLHDSGIVISWTLEDTGNRFSDCVTYQIYAYQETIHEPSTDSWRHVGDVKAMLLPMAVTLNQFQENQRYYFAVRGVDDHSRFGPFSLPKTWTQS
ncbi:activating transcription factor 7-interacting protein 1 isoform X2 [Drosophila tropicalis]|uniref:activating transcription factor 7-interacting protein 1 isoform X2 n=1 Tax=Drosophila tropicalis TaxID=46794 RepID=UPI0035ABF079